MLQGFASDMGFEKKSSVGNRFQQSFFLKLGETYFISLASSIITS